MGVPTLSKSNCYNQILWEFPHFQNRTVTTRFAVVPTDFKIELLQPDLWEFPHFQNQTCYNQICGSSYRFHLYKFLNSHLFVIQLGMSSHISESNCKILNLREFPQNIFA
ncbi:hypothetical protein LEP1GSC115_0626 [Leptospira interrogans serovar Australis str. 200703203]|uniref:Uncharacterized protein n=1 Tax=Leptospira interrogans serovar Australis str. 200703203 TaxID=1085541 RepID=N1UKQ1_LEPIR|nr:hypothetical protein LEP1GSC115_0626 [Leptospira interrogans serovar Australis str. 200703203]